MQATDHSQNSQKQEEMLGRYRAAMLLAAAGDAIGYRRGAWEFCYNGDEIYRDMMKITKNQGVLHLQVNKRDFPYSDDTVMHIATAKGLLQSGRSATDEKICTSIAKQYKECWDYMGGRAPGGTCRKSISILDKDGSNWKDIKYEQFGGGCGAAMRAACIGLYFYDDLDKTIRIAVESGRTTHHHPVGYMGSVIAAYFTALGVLGYHPHSWISYFFKNGLKTSKNYIEGQRQSQENLTDWDKMDHYLKDYAHKRSMDPTQSSEPVFEADYTTEKRDEFYREIAVGNWAGACGTDAVMIAYDALLSAIDSQKKGRKQGEEQRSEKLWQEVCLRSMMHCGDSDSTGTIAGAWYGAWKGLKGVPECHYNVLEDRQLIERLGTGLFEGSYKEADKKKEKSDIHE